MTSQGTDLESVISLSGLKAAGKDELCKRLTSYGYASLRLSDPIRAEAVRRGFPQYTTDMLQDIGNEGRRQGGPGYWATKTIELARERGLTKIVINGVRNPGETKALLSAAGDRCTLAGIVAPLMVRYGRVSGRGQVEDKYDLEKFLAMDDRDRGVGEPADGQHVDRCLALVPLENVYNNVGTLADYHAWIDAFHARILAGLKAGFPLGHGC
ncbi:MAG TPA: hypothetical protein VL426_04655 [Candidatus Binatia bacterium]|jgi:dephospho-CoA kinase|nr:hypothetical protein [Candidatus Binatia bacterium]